jgi:hypothetical protein
MFSNLSLDSCIGNKGEKEWWRKVALHPGTYPKSQGGACAFFLHFLVFGGCGLLYQIGLTGFGNRPDWFWWNRSDRFWELA